MKTGRVETYIHKDDVTENKGAAIVCVTCDSDFAAKTEEFIEFSKEVAKMAYGASFMNDVPEGIRTEVNAVGDHEVTVVDMSDGYKFSQVLANHAFIEETFPEFEKKRLELEEKLKELISVEEIKVIKL